LDDSPLIAIDVFERDGRGSSVTGTSQDREGDEGSIAWHPADECRFAPSGPLIKMEAFVDDDPPASSQIAPKMSEPKAKPHAARREPHADRRRREA
jgi:hypothetical protein